MSRRSSAWPSYRPCCTGHGARYRTEAGKRRRRCRSIPWIGRVVDAGSMEVKMGTSKTGEGATRRVAIMGPGMLARVLSAPWGTAPPAMGPEMSARPFS